MDIAAPTALTPQACLGSLSLAQHFLPYFPSTAHKHTLFGTWHPCTGKLVPTACFTTPALPALFERACLRVQNSASLQYAWNAETGTLLRTDVHCAAGDTATLRCRIR